MSLSPPRTAASGDGPAERRWTESDELRLLRAALEIAEEAAEAFDPSMPLFARLGRALRESTFTGDEILAKIRDLRRSYEEKCYKIRVGDAVGDSNSAAFEISKRIWGSVTKKSKKKKKRNKKKKRKRKVKKMYIA